MHVPSSFSSAICVQSMEESRRTATTKLVQVYTDRQTTSFIDYSIEAGILLGVQVYTCIYVSGMSWPNGQGVGLEIV
jgi:hypothetical protein